MLLTFFVAARRSQMIYFVLAALALGFVKAEKSAVLELTGDAPTVHFGELGGSDVLTLVHSPAEDKLSCSGTFAASDVRIAGTSTTVADLIGEVASLRQEVGEVAALRQEIMTVRQFVGMVPTQPSFPPASLPPALPQRNLCWNTFFNNSAIDASDFGLSRCSQYGEAENATLSANGFRKGDVLRRGQWFYCSTRQVCLRFQGSDGNLCAFGTCHGCNGVYGSEVESTAYLQYLEDGRIVVFSTTLSAVPAQWYTTSSTLLPYAETLN